MNLRTRGFSPLVLLIVGVLVIVFALASWQVARPRGSSPGTASSTPAFTSAVTQEALPTYPKDLVAVYWIVESQTSTRERSWPTKSIWIKRSEQPAKLLAHIGKTGEYPNWALLSPAHDYVAIDLETKVQLLHIQTKEVRTVLEAPNGVSGMAFSPDGSELWVSEGHLYDERDNTYHTIHAIDVATGEAEVRARGKNEGLGGDLSIDYARSDGIVFYHLNTYSESGPPGGALDTNTGTYLNTHGSYALSDDGKIALGEPATSRIDPCEGIGGPYTLPFTHKVVEPVTGRELGVVGQPGKIFRFISFSPDGSQVVYYAAPPYENCDSPREPGAYYRQAIAPGSVSQFVKDPNALLREWNRPKFFVEDDPADTDWAPIRLIQLGPLRNSVVATPLLRVHAKYVSVIGGYYE